MSSYAQTLGMQGNAMNGHKEAETAQKETARLLPLCHANK